MEKPQSEEFDIFVWSDEVQDYVLLYRGTDMEEAKKLRRRFLLRQTRERHRKEREGEQ